MEMACKIENMMNMLYKLCWQADQGQDVRILAGMAKYYCSKATCEVVDDAIQVLAGIGVVGDHRVGRYYIDPRPPLSTNARNGQRLLLQGGGE